MSSSSSAAFTPLLAAPVADESTVLRGERATRPLCTPELRSGEWTRFGDGSALGDTVTEDAVAALVEDARQAARSQGYAVGWAQGRREAAAEATLAARARDREAAEERKHWAARQDAAVRALQHAAEQLARATEEAQALVRAQAVELARELTEVLVGHELRSSPDTATDVAARVLAAGPADQPFIARVHPDVARGPAASVLAGSGVRVVADAGLDPADAVVEVDGQILDLRLRAGLDRVREALS